MQIDEDFHIDTINYNIEHLSDILYHLQQEFQSFQLKLTVTHSITDTVAAALSQAFDNITKAWQQQIHTSQVSQDKIDHLISKIQTPKINTIKTRSHRRHLKIHKIISDQSLNMIYMT